MYKDPNDGMTYEWDTKKRAWFPRINEDFLAQYQMNYGFTKDGVAEPTKPEEVSPEDLAKTTETGKLRIWFLRKGSKKANKNSIKNLKETSPEDWANTFKGKSFLELLILVSTNPQYDDSRLL